MYIYIYRYVDRSKNISMNMQDRHFFWEGRGGSSKYVYGYWGDFAHKKGWSIYSQSMTIFHGETIYQWLEMVIWPKRLKEGIGRGIKPTMMWDNNYVDNIYSNQWGSISNYYIGTRCCSQAIGRISRSHTMEISHDIVEPIVNFGEQNNTWFSSIVNHNSGDIGI